MHDDDDKCINDTMFALFRSEAEDALADLEWIRSWAGRRPAANPITISAFERAAAAAVARLAFASK